MTVYSLSSQKRSQATSLAPRGLPMEEPLQFR
jgi:hypothetical protein